MSIFVRVGAETVCVDGPGGDVFGTSPRLAVPYEILDREVENSLARQRRESWLRGPLGVSAPACVEEMRRHVETIAVAMGFYVADVATDDHVTTFYVSHGSDRSRSGRVLVNNNVATSWCPLRDARVGEALGVLLHTDRTVTSVGL